jgi:hypothetical protein
MTYFDVNFCSGYTTARQAAVLKAVREIRSANASQVGRWAIDALMERPETEHTPEGANGNGNGVYPERLPNTLISREQANFIQGIADSKGVSKAQVMRNAIQALEDSLYPQEKAKLAAMLAQPEAN